MKRHVWVDRGSWKLFPNIYTVLVAAPGGGKGGAMNPAVEIAKAAGTVNLLSDRLTMPYVLEKLSKGFQAHSVTATGGVAFGTDASALLYAPELSVFIRYPDEYLPDLSNLWDAREGDYPYCTRGKGEFMIRSPSVTILAGSAPAWLVRSIPSNAIGGGFTRRLNCVYGREQKNFMPWPVLLPNDPAKDALIDGLRHISANLNGEFTFEDNAKPVFEKCHSESKSDEFDDEATSVYKTSKWVHATKLAMSLSAAKSDSRKISKEDFELALEKTEEVITDLALVFRASGESDLVEVADKVLRFIEIRGYASRAEIMHHLWRDIGSTENMSIILATLHEGGLVTEYQQGNKTLYKTVPTRSKP